MGGGRLHGFGPLHRHLTPPCSRAQSPGPLGQSFGALGSVALAGMLLARLCAGEAPDEMVDVHAVGEIIPISKDHNGIRPIVLSSILRRIALGALVRRLAPDVAKYGGDEQLGL
eukprot:6973004-Alexandrium_andersonii.AAC.1